jgi:hypothetical protein
MVAVNQYKYDKCQFCKIHIRTRSGLKTINQVAKNLKIADSF